MHVCYIVTRACTCVCVCCATPVPPHFVQLFQWLSRLLAEHTSLVTEMEFYGIHTDTRASRRTCGWIYTRVACAHTCVSRITWSRNTTRHRYASRETLKTIREYNSVPGHRCIFIDIDVARCVFQREKIER